MNITVTKYNTDPTGWQNYSKSVGFAITIDGFRLNGQFIIHGPVTVSKVAQMIEAVKAPRFTKTTSIDRDVEVERNGNKIVLPCVHNYESADIELGEEVKQEIVDKIIDLV